MKIETLFFDAKKGTLQTARPSMLVAQNASGVFVAWPGADYQNAQLQPVSVFGGEPIPDRFSDAILAKYSDYSKRLTTRRPGVAA